MTDFFNTGLTQQQFLDQYWQKKPLVIRQAFPDFQSAISPDELAGLACEPEVESRLIVEDTDAGPWQLTSGPLSNEDFVSLPESHWTLLVQDIDKHVPETRSVLAPFKFIPNWRRDDLMVSFAPQHGSVGPHTDSYDVFLLQGLGTRQWQVTEKPLHNASLIDNIDLQVLAEFESADEWLLEEGDMLYLPPHYGHHGVAMEDCMTFSIGFRAPKQTEALDAVINELLEQGLATQHYRDADLQAIEHEHEIDQQAVLRLKKLLHDTIEQAEPLLLGTLGKLVTETKPSLANLAGEIFAEQPTSEMLVAHFSAGEVLHRNPYLRFAWAEQAPGGTVFMAGEGYVLSQCQKKTLLILAEQSVIQATDWQVLMRDPQAVDLLCQLIAEGGWSWQQLDEA